MTEANRIRWQTSSYTTGQGNCVEIGWQTSSYTSGQGNCVEVGATGARIHVRDTKNRAGGMLTLSPFAWQSFVTIVG